MDRRCLTDTGLMWSKQLLRSHTGSIKNGSQQQIKLVDCVATDRQYKSQGNPVFLVYSPSVPST